MLDLSLRNNIFVNNILDCALQELDILFTTGNTELIGNPYYGTNFEQFLWELTSNEERIKTYVMNKLTNETYFVSGLERYIDVTKDYDESGEIYCLISISLLFKGQEYNKTYKFINTK